MKKPLTILSLIIILLFNTTLFAEKAPVKFGKIELEELEMTIYEHDTSAVAVILCDYGTSSFIYTESEGFQVQFNRILRVKILKKEGYDWAKYEILSRIKYDDISQLKGISYTLQDGQIIKTKLERDQIFKEETNKYWETSKFEMPNIKVGSVFDIEYTITSDLWRIHDWYFQEEIPTKYSYYEVRIPEYFTFKTLQKGYINIDATQEINNDYISYTSKERDSGQGGNPTGFTNHKIDFKRNDFILKGENIPAFVKESYITSMYNYLAAIEFELQDYKFPYGNYNNVSATWEQIGLDLMKDEDFGFQLLKAGFLKDKIEEIQSTESSDEEKIAAMYYYIQSSMNWNNLNGVYSKNISKAWDEKNGNAADINLMLTAALSRMEYNADPVILSTRSNGIIHPAQIMVDQFNYVIASVNINGKTILLDATDKQAPFGILPERCLNDKGRLINKNGGDWVEIKPNAKKQIIYQTQFSVQADGLVAGKMKETHKEYAAMNKRSTLKYHTNTEEYLKEYQDIFTETELILDTIIDKDDISKPLILSYDFESENLVESAGNLLLIDPFLCSNLTKNPYKLERREYPVDYSYPQTNSYMATITIPEGYMVEELPQVTKVGLPENGALFLYSTQQTGDKIIVVSKVNINKVMFLPEEYENLKEFYNTVIDAQSKKIVLKKI